MRFKTSFILSFPGIFLLAAFFFTGSTLFSQPGFRAFDEVRADDFSAVLPAGSDHEAIVLAASDELGFQVNGPADDLERVLKHRVRMLILSDSGASRALTEVPLTVAGREEEHLSDLRASVYRLVNGKVIRQKVKPVTLTVNVPGGLKKIRKITVPGAEKGSIIEYSYTLTSPFLFNLIRWPLQESIPVLYRECSATLPEFLLYRIRYQGYLPRPSFTEDRVNEVFTFTEQTSSRQSAAVQTYTIPFQSNSQRMEWVMRNIPAWWKEPWGGVIQDHGAALLIEVNSYSLPSKALELVSAGWEGLARSLQDDVRFGRSFNDLAPLEPELEKIRLNPSPGSGIIRQVTQCISSKLIWNGKDGIFPDQSLQQLLASGTGNSASMNLLLVAMLRKLNLAASPVLISTQEHGPVWPGNPDPNQFNRVLAVVTVDSLDYFVDATARGYPPGIIPARCISGAGLVVGGRTVRADPGEGMWLAETVQTALSWREDGSITGMVTALQSGLAAAETREGILVRGRMVTGNELFRIDPAVELGDIRFLNADSICEPLETTASFLYKGLPAGDTLIIRPSFFLPSAAVSFADETRQNPVDLSCSREYTCLLKMEVPAGYHLAVKPSDEVIGLADQTVKFIYSCSEVGGVIQVMGKMVFKRTFFLPGEYADLRSLSQQAAWKLDDPVLLKRD